MEKSDSGYVVVGDSFPVKILYARKIPDIGLLIRTDGRTFADINVMRICPAPYVPWVQDPHGWDCRVKGYHCPVDIFKQTNMPLLSCCITNYNSVTYHTGHHFAVQEEFLGGSSGGAMILERGNGMHKLLGVLITTQVTTMIGNVETEAVSDMDSQAWSVRDPPVSITTCVVPSLCNFSIRKRTYDLNGLLTHFNHTLDL